MAVTDRSRHRLRQRLERTLGEDHADVLMQHLPPTGWADVATKGDLDHQRTLLERDIALQGSELHRDLAELRADLQGQIADLRDDMQRMNNRCSSSSSAPWPAWSWSFSWWPASPPDHPTREVSRPLRPEEHLVVHLPEFASSSGDGAHQRWDAVDGGRRLRPRGVAVSGLDDCPHLSIVPGDCHRSCR
jgi:hypothetical protein